MREETNFIIKKELLLSLEAAVSDDYPSESCGIFFGGESGITGFRKISNEDKGEEAQRHFSIDPLELFKAETQLEKEGLKIMGFYHSHPDCIAVLSGEDIEYMIPEQVYVTVSVHKKIINEVRAYKKDAESGEIREYGLTEA